MTWPIKDDWQHFPGLNVFKKVRDYNSLAKWANELRKNNIRNNGGNGAAGPKIDYEEHYGVWVANGATAIPGVAAPTTISWTDEIVNSGHFDFSAPGFNLSIAGAGVVYEAQYWVAISSVAGSGYAPEGAEFRIINDDLPAPVLVPGFIDPVSSPTFSLHAIHPGDTTLPITFTSAPIRFTHDDLVKTGDVYPFHVQFFDPNTSASLTLDTAGIRVRRVIPQSPKS